MKRTVPILLAVLIVVLTGCSQSDYRAAVSAYEKKDYETAISLFDGLGSYEDSESYLLAATQEYAEDMISEMGKQINSEEKLNEFISICKNLTQEEFAQIESAEDFEEMFSDYVGSLGQSNNWEEGLSLVQKATFLSPEGTENALVSCGRWGCIESAEARLKESLKSPRSYYRYSASVSLPRESAGHYVVTVTLNYGATNSFGAEVTSDITLPVDLYVDLEDIDVRINCPY